MRCADGCTNGRSPSLASPKLRGGTDANSTQRGEHNCLASAHGRIALVAAQTRGRAAGRVGVPALSAIDVYLMRVHAIDACPHESATGVAPSAALGAALAWRRRD